MVVVYNHTTLDEGYNSRVNCSICLGFNCGNGFNSRHLHHKTSIEKGGEIEWIKLFI